MLESRASAGPEGLARKGQCTFQGCTSGANPLAPDLHEPSAPPPPFPNPFWAFVKESPCTGEETAPHLLSGSLGGFSHVNSRDAVSNDREQEQPRHGDGGKIWTGRDARGVAPEGASAESGIQEGGGGGVWTAKTVKRPRQQPTHPQYANYRALLTRKRHTMPHPAQPQHTNHWAPRTRKRHQQEHRPQRPTERSDPTQHAKGRTGDCSGPRKGATTRRNVTQGDGSVQPNVRRENVGRSESGSCCPRT